MRRVAALPGGGDLERVSQRALPGTPRTRARAPRRRRPTCAPATTARPPARRWSRERRVEREPGQRAAERGAVADGREQRADLVDQEVLEHVEVGGHDRQLGGQRLERGEPEALLDRREGERVGGAEQPLHLAGRLRAEHAHVRRRRRARRRARRTARARAGSRTASCRRRSAAAGRARARGRAARRSRRAASASPCAARCRPTVSTVNRSPGRRGARARPRRAPVGSAAGRRRCARGRPRSRTRPASRSTHGCETHSTRSGSTIERSWQAISDGEVKSSTWWTVRMHVVDHAVVAQGERRVGRQAVLGVDDVVAAEQRPQPLGVDLHHRAGSARRTARRAARGARVAAARRPAGTAPRRRGRARTARPRGRAAPAPRPPPARARRRRAA